MPISRRGPAACFIAACILGANRNPMPICWMHSSTISCCASMLTPSSASTSALPQPLETERLPCLATTIPQAATTKAVVVEMLNVLRLSPPVPQVSTIVVAQALMRTAFLRILRAAPVTSCTVSPFIRSAVMNEAISAAVACPPMISSMTAVISSSVRSMWCTALSIASLIIT